MNITSKPTFLVKWISYNIMFLWMILWLALLTSDAEHWWLIPVAGEGFLTLLALRG